MSKITSPILLDSTGQDINNTLKDIHEVLKAANTLINDNIVSNDRVWSSKKIIDALTIEATATGTNSVSFDSIAATPLAIKTVISKAPILVHAVLLDSKGNVQETEYLVPLNGTYYWDTGLFILEDGTETKLASHYLVAAQGTNILHMDNIDSIEVTYKTISKQGGGTVDFDMINGGSAREEA